MRISKIYGIVLRYVFNFRHSLDRLADAFYWPTLDLLIWGLTSEFFKSQQMTSQTNGITGSQIVVMIISGIIFWLIVWRAQYEITINLLLELWDKNLINLFVAPLKFSEWIVSVIIVGIIKCSLSLIFIITLAYILYAVKFFLYGFYLIPFILLLILTGWWIGFLVAGIIFRFGTKVQTLAWAAVAAISPFSAIYYPVSILPVWAQKVASIIPTSYIFEGAREVMQNGYMDKNKILMSLGLNIIYLLLSLWFVNRSFKKLLNKGLVKAY